MMNLTMLIFNIILLGGCLAQELSTFLSAPDQTTVRLHALTNIKPHLQAPGLIFLTPFLFGVRFYAPTIYKQNGDLVWAGQYTAEGNANNFHVVQYKGQPGNFFLYHDGSGTVHQDGVIRIFNGSYNQISPSFGARNGLSLPDDHEANVPTVSNGDSLIQDIYQVVKHDLSDYSGPEDGYVLSGCFQEFSLKNNRLTFQWCSLDHIPLYETYVFLPNSGNYSNSLSGDGSQNNPWDYFHINAIDKDADGNYLVSARHTSALYKVAGNKHSMPGSIIWRLGGKENSFTMRPQSFNFSFQHDGRWQSSPSKKSTLLSLFDNGSDGEGLQSAPASSGLVVSVNEAQMIASLKHQYTQPEYRSAGSQGSVQIHSNGNAFIAWGQVPYISEFTRNGELLYNAKFGSLDPYQNEFNSYRGFKSPWVGTPRVAPSVFAYSRRCDSATKYAYASWNGATEVGYWKLQTSNSESGPWSLQDEVYKKTSYETVIAYDSTGFQKFVQVLAYNATGSLIATSAATGVFVPLNKYHQQCHAMHCDSPFNYGAAEDMSQNCLSSASV